MCKTIPENKSNPSLAEKFARTYAMMHPADAAEHLQDCPLDEQIQFLLRQDINEAAETIAEMEWMDQIELMSQLPPQFAADLLARMSPDDAADALEDLEESVRSEILLRIAPKDAADIKSLLRFDPDCAGGVMNTEILALDQNLNVSQAINLIRERVDEAEIPYYAYIVDEARHLLGVLSLRDLIRSPSWRVLRDLLKEQNLIYASYDIDKEEAARLISRYNLFALPVTDHDKRILGVVTVDDVIDIIQEEASEDMQSMVGAGADESTDSPWTYSLRMRLPWLLINLFNSAISAYVVHLFEGTIAQMTILAVLMPVVANQAGNTGQQSLAVMIRQLAVERFDRKKAWLAVVREARVGLATGFVIASVVFVILAVGLGNGKLGGVMALALGCDMLLGAVAGASIPLILREVGRDPAQASSIFLTTLTDGAGFFTFLGFAALFLL